MFTMIVYILVFLIVIHGLNKIIYTLREQTLAERWVINTLMGETRVFIEMDSLTLNMLTNNSRIKQIL